MHGPEYERRALPGRRRLTLPCSASVQNNTHLHPAWANLKAYSDHLGAEFLVATFTYDKDSFGPKSSSGSSGYKKETTTLSVVF